MYDVSNKVLLNDQMIVVVSCMYIHRMHGVYVVKRFYVYRTHFVEIIVKRCRITTYGDSYSRISFIVHVTSVHTATYSRAHKQNHVECDANAISAISPFDSRLYTDIQQRNAIMLSPISIVQIYNMHKRSPSA
jgi:hypothetical protein